MKIYNTIITVVIVLMSTGVIAQNSAVSTTEKENYKEAIATYFKNLNLSSEQKASYQEIERVHLAQLQLVKGSAMATPDKLKEIQRIQSDKDAGLINILSVEQYAIHQSFKEEQQRKMMANFLGYERLQLTEEQKPPFAEITERYGLQFKKLKNSTASRFSKLREFKSIQSKKNIEIKEVLTTEQYNVYLAIQEERKQKLIEAARNR